MRRFVVAFLATFLVAVLLPQLLLPTRLSLAKVDPSGWPEMLQNRNIEHTYWWAPPHQEHREFRDILMPRFLIASVNLGGYQWRVVCGKTA